MSDGNLFSWPRERVGADHWWWGWHQGHREHFLDRVDRVDRLHDMTTQWSPPCSGRQHLGCQFTKKRKFHHQLLFSWENPHYLWHKSCQHFIFSFYIPHMFASQAPRPDVVGPCDHHRVKSVWLCLGVSRGKWILCWCSSVWQILWVQRWRGLWKVSGAIFFIINMI